MKKIFLRKIIIVGLLAAFVPVYALPDKAYALEMGSLTDFLIDAGLQYAMIYAQLKYLDGPGRGSMLANMKQQYGVCQDKRANQTLGNVMGRLMPVLYSIDPELRSKPYEYFVNNEKSFNAFCTLGHNISVNKGLFESLDYDEDEIAFVIGHEIAHGQNGDPIKNQLKRNSITVLASYLANRSGNTLDMLAMSVADMSAGAKLVTLPAEKRADREAFRYCVAAGFNPGAGAALWQRVMDQIDGKSNKFLLAVFGDHPGNESRRNLYAKDMEEWSGGMVRTDPFTAGIHVNGKFVFAPKHGAGRGSLERAYLAAGIIADEYRKVSEKQNGTLHSECREGTLFLNGREAYIAQPGEDCMKISASLNEAINN